MKVFDICTGKVKKPRTITILPVPDRVIILVKNGVKGSSGDLRDTSFSSSIVTRISMPGTMMTWRIMI